MRTTGEDPHRAKNALTLQYTRFFEMDGVELVIAADALGAIAEQAMKRGTGARGLRAIMRRSCSTPCMSCHHAATWLASCSTPR